MDLFIIRHGESANNALADIRERQVDPPLTDLGVQQAKMLAIFLAGGQFPEHMDSNGTNNKIKMKEGSGITTLYVSPMYRTLQTVQPIAVSLGLDPMVWVDLHEEGGMYLNHGEDRGLVGYPGKTRKDIASEFGSYQLPSEITAGGWWSGGHEGKVAFTARANRVSDSLKNMAISKEIIALITHGAFMNVLLKALLGTISSSLINFRHHNTGITRINLRNDGRLELWGLNQVHHLSSDLVSDLSSSTPVIYSPES